MDLFLSKTVTGICHHALLPDVYNNKTDVNWESLHSEAPKGISIMSQLLISASQVDDINIYHNPGPLLKHPESFHASLAQISNEACNTFSKAHTNMEKIQKEMITVPEDIQKCVEIIQSGKKSGKQENIQKTLTNCIQRIQNAGENGSRLSKEMADDFNQLIELIGQVLEATSATLSYRERKIEADLQVAINENGKHERTMKEKKQLLDELKRRMEGKEMEKKCLNKERQVLEKSMLDEGLNLFFKLLLAIFLWPFLGKFDFSNWLQNVTQLNAKAENIDRDLNHIREQYISCYLEYNQHFVKNIFKKIQLKQCKEKLAKDHPVLLLQEGLIQLSGLKEQWAKMAQHFQSFSNVTTGSVQKSFADFTNDARKAQTDKSLLEFMTESIQSACHKSKSMLYIAQTYVEVSDHYILNNVKQLRKMLIADPRDCS